MDEAEYRRLAFGEVGPVEEQARMAELAGPAGDILSTCARCHGYDGAGRGTGAYPRLAGQSAAYLFQSLSAYASGNRPSGIMQPLAAALSQDEMRALAAYFAGHNDAPFPPRPENPDPRLRQSGGAIAAVGAPQQGVPPCSGCHGSGTLRDSRYPSLNGQHAGYIADQLRLWQQGKRGNTALSKIMAAVARDMTEEQIRAVSLYYSLVRPREPAVVGAASQTELPK
jgi:cytochrome c553